MSARGVDQLAMPPSTSLTDPGADTELPSPPSVRERFSMSPLQRLVVASTLTYSTGMLLGLSHGARTSALRFRAENSHRLPTNKNGWYFYHRAKNWYVARAAFREGNAMAMRMLPWVVVFFSVEETVDTARLDDPDDEKHKDFLSTTVAGLAAAGAFSAWHRLPIATAAQTAKIGLACGLGFGLMQDVVHLLQGQRLAYVELGKRIFNNRDPSHIG